MEKLTLEDIKEILRIEVRKSILYSHQVSEETNKHSESGFIKGEVDPKSRTVFLMS